MEMIIPGADWGNALPGLVLFGVSLLSWFILGHCDSMGGPVVRVALKALKSSDVTPVLRWIRREEEDQVRAAFERTLAMRHQSPEAAEMAEMYFFETLVRLHRSGEGAPYHGLKEAGHIDPVIEMADDALSSGDEAALVRHMAELVSEGIKTRYRKAARLAKEADRTVEGGRRFVEAYVDYIHFVERLFNDAMGHAPHH